MKKKIWFNHWFNSAYHFIRLIREQSGDQEFEFFGTNANANSAVLLACDHAWQEPAMPQDKYVDYCLEFCREHAIDVFVPRRGMLDIVSRAGEFEANGTRLLAERDARLLKSVQDKAEFYRLCQEKGLPGVPMHRVVNTPSGFYDAYRSITGAGRIACFKPLKGEGASGFRVIRSMANDIGWLMSPINHKLSIEQVMTILKKHESFPDVMVMEYMGGYEYSVDCLGHEGRLLASVQRRKADDRVRSLEFNPQVDEAARSVFAAFPLSYVSNIQLKFTGSEVKILEVNPRMSGGLHISCISGVNFPLLALRLLLDGRAEVPEPRYGVAVTQIEKEILLNR